ncbi:hypothetical protein SAMN06265339_1376 [Desulfurobacterium pacificum]|uniref:Restriction endonuclease n=1 Tax=Desulfurobacterium pacificum TaxID=240166 RepID=A0ABY1NQR1_9BACT|nr:hypothetical protein [Desulfurobacterium pacificum]SMP15273.1 hypothetical protein SAMN06265339_1376 [Desulfurobacterium pacificum]
MKNSLCEKLEKFKRELYSISGSSLFKNIDYEDCKRICEKAGHDDFIGSALLELEKVIDSMKLDYDETHNNFHKKYWELFTYHFLKYEKRICIDRIKETSSKTPDFQVTFNDKRFSLEVKTLNRVYPNLRYKEEQEEFLETKVKLEEKLREEKIASAVNIIQPYKGRDENYNDSSVALVIETLISKIEHNLKLGQHPSSFDRRILWVVLEQLPLFNEGKKVSVPVYPDFSYSCACISGELWYTCFGERGDLIFKPPEFEDRSNIDRRLEKDGIMKTHKEIDGVVFLIVQLDGKKETVAFHRYDDSLLKEFFYTFADYTNNDINENDYYYKLFPKKKKR